MVKKLFDDFLESEEQYKACERYWEQLVQDTATSLGQVGEWQRWIFHGYADGTPLEQDGNPIFDGWSKELGRAFRIMQHRAIGNDLEIAAWLKRYEDEYTDLPANELVINLSLSQESAEIAKALLYKWMTPATSPDEMQSFIQWMVPH